MLEISRAESDELFMVNIKSGRCSYLAQVFPAVLVKWIDGPFKDPSDSAEGSVWEVLDLAGDTEFVWLQDHNGPHKSIKARAA